MAPMRRDIAEAKLMALGAGAKLARQKLGWRNAAVAPSNAAISPLASDWSEECDTTAGRPSP